MPIHHFDARLRGVALRRKPLTIRASDTRAKQLEGALLPRRDGCRSSCAEEAVGVCFWCHTLLDPPTPPPASASKQTSLSRAAQNDEATRVRKKMGQRCPEETGLSKKKNERKPTYSSEPRPVSTYFERSQIARDMRVLAVLSPSLQRPTSSNRRRITGCNSQRCNYTQQGHIAG